MGSIDIDSLFTDIPLEETIEISTNELFKNNSIVHGFKKSELKNLQYLTMKESHFIFSNIFITQTN